MEIDTRFGEIGGLVGVSDVYAAHLKQLDGLFQLRTRVKILIVLDGGISLTEGTSAFGVGRLVRLLRESRVGCTQFDVDTARRNGSTAGAPRYTNFRFDQAEGDQLVLNQYSQVWCFGFAPGNDGGPDSNIVEPGQLPASDSELRALTEWMNKRRGGLLAMGDHDYLGASMCHRIPRIRSMRRWTNQQNVPPIGGASDPDTHLRHDTNQPATLSQRLGTGSIPFLNQEDTVPQEIDWVPWVTQQVHIFQMHQRPHPILCHPVHGPIDVMPDHPHEGWLYEDDEIDLTASYSFDGLDGDEYPTVDGVQPAPMVIAHGTTTPNPPFQLNKGPSPKKRFAMVGVYDGHPVNVGRVVTDSTWHHWFDENIENIEAAGGENWDKISRYYLNVAVWLDPPGRLNLCFAHDILATHFSYLGFQEYSRSASVFDLGKALHTHMTRYLGPCWVTQWVFEQVRLIDDDLWKYMSERMFCQPRVPRPPDPCLSCPPFELVEIAVLGGLVHSTFDVADEIKLQAHKGADRLDIDIDRLIEYQQEGVKFGVQELRGALSRSLSQLASITGLNSEKGKTTPAV